MSRDQNLTAGSSLPEKASELDDRKGMQSELWLVEHNQRWQPRMQQERREADEPQRSVGHPVRREDDAGVALSPPEPEMISLLRLKHEVPKERRNLPNGSDDAPVSTVIALLQRQKDRCEVASVVAQHEIVRCRHEPFDRRISTGVVKVVDPASAK